MKDIHIPPEVVEAAAWAVYETWCAVHGITKTAQPWDEIDEEERAACFAEARAAIRAALNAWPGVFGTELEDHTGVYRRIILPLPREPRDDDWGKPVGKEEW